MSEENQEPLKGDKASKLAENPHTEPSPELSALLSALPEEAAPILEGLPEAERRIMTRAMFQMSVRRSWEGPLPDPETLKGYNECFEGGARAVFNLTKDQSDHRRALETSVMARELNQSGRGQNYAFILALIIFLSGVLLAYLGHDVVAGVAIGFDVIGLAAVFIVGKYGIKMDIRSKRARQSENDDDNNDELKKLTSSDISEGK